MIILVHGEKRKRRELEKERKRRKGRRKGSIPGVLVIV
jgi:hypothetical protein